MDTLDAASKLEIDANSHMSDHWRPQIPFSACERPFDLVAVGVGLSAHLRQYTSSTNIALMAGKNVSSPHWIVKREWTIKQGEPHLADGEYQDLKETMDTKGFMADYRQFYAGPEGGGLQARIRRLFCTDFDSYLFFCEQKHGFVRRSWTRPPRGTAAR